MLGNLLKDCPLIQNKREKQKFKKKENKRAMIATWNDSETSDNESDEEHTANNCLIAKEV